MKLYAGGRSSCSYRVRIVLYAKRVPFELVPVSTEHSEHRTPLHRARSPLGQVPVLELERDGQPAYLTQSMAIIEYLEQRFPQPALLPEDPFERARARELAEIVNAGTQPLQNSGVTDYLRDELRVDDKAWARRFIRRGLEALNHQAAHTAGRFLVGDTPSIADVFLVPQLANARRFRVPLDGLDRLIAIDERACALPGWDLAHPDRQPGVASS